MGSEHETHAEVRRGETPWRARLVLRASLQQQCQHGRASEQGQALPHEVVRASVIG